MLDHRPVAGREEMARTPVADIQALKSRREKILMLTAYDFPSARIAEEAGVDMILVGDSLGMVVLGYDSTLPVTMDEMLHHTKAVVRGTARAMAETVRRITQVGIPVVGHIGLTPQSINQLSGYKVQGKTPEAAERLMEDAIAPEQAGALPPS